MKITRTLFTALFTMVSSIILAQLQDISVEGMFLNASGSTHLYVSIMGGGMIDTLDVVSDEAGNFSFSVPGSAVAGGNMTIGFIDCNGNYQTQSFSLDPLINPLTIVLDFCPVVVPTTYTILGHVSNQPSASIPVTANIYGGGATQTFTFNTDVNGDFTGTFESSSTQGSADASIIDCQGQTVTTFSYWYPGTPANLYFELDYCAQDSVIDSTYCFVDLEIFDTDSMGSAYDIFAGVDYDSTAVSYNWEFGDGQSSTEAYPTNVYGSTGWYWLCITTVDANGCVAFDCDTLMVNADGTVGGGAQQAFTLNVIAAGTVGVNENEASNYDLTVFPNPINEASVLNIKTIHPASGKMEIINAQGQIVHRQNWNSGTQVSLPSASLNAGLYFIRLTDQLGKSTTVSFVK